MRKKTPYEVRRDLKTKEFWSRFRRRDGDGETHLIAEVDNNPDGFCVKLNPVCLHHRELRVFNNGYDWEQALHKAIAGIKDLTFS